MVDRLRLLVGRPGRKRFSRCGAPHEDEQHTHNREGQQQNGPDVQESHGLTSLAGMEERYSFGREALNPSIGRRRFLHS